MPVPKKAYIEPSASSHAHDLTARSSAGYPSESTTASVHLPSSYSKHTMSNNQHAMAHNQSLTTFAASASLPNRSPHPLATVTFPPRSPESGPFTPLEEGSAMNRAQGTTSEPTIPRAQHCHSDTLTLTPDGCLRTPAHQQVEQFGRRAVLSGQPFQFMFPACASNPGFSNPVFSDVRDEELYPASKRQKRSHTHARTKDMSETVPSYVENSRTVVGIRRNAVAGQNGSSTPDVCRGGHSGSAMPGPLCPVCGGNLNLCLGECIR